MKICRVPSCYRLEELGWLLLGGNIGIERGMLLAANNVVYPLYLISQRLVSAPHLIELYV
jgi:hypothetical protein